MMTDSLRKGVLVALMSFLSIFLAGCSTFSRDWKAALKTPVPASEISGPWEGRWLSDVNGHTGKLRCLLSKKDEARYHARFWATYWKVFRFTYGVELNGSEEDGKWKFTGQEDLGKLAGGIYRYDGFVTLTNFYANYQSKYDHGTFRMNRP
jgi:hypothetical protein